MRRIRTGIIGQGRSGRDIHVAALKRDKMAERFEIAAITDLIPERCLETAAEFPECKVYEDYSAMLADQSLELIVNASFSHQHVPISIEALSSGFHVLSEKPLAASLAEVDRVYAKAQECGRIFTVFQEARYDPTFQKVLELCKSGILGRVIMARFTRNNADRRWDWQTLSEMNGGALLNTGSHSLDQALKLFGDSMPEKIVCVMDRVNSFGDAEDHVKMLFSSPGHPTIDFEVSSCAPYSPPRFQVYGECGGISATPGKVEWRYFSPGDAPVQKLSRQPLANRSYCSENLDWFENLWQDSGKRGTAWLGEQLYLNLYEAILNGAALEISREEVSRQIAIIEECHRQNPQFSRGQQTK